MKTLDQHVATGSFTTNNSQAVASTSTRSACQNAAALLCMTMAMSFGVAAQQAAAPASSSPAAAQKTMSAEIPVFLAKSVDSKKLKAGEEVDGKTAVILHLKDGTVVSRGAKVEGHVAQSKARSNGDSESALQIVFDKIDLPGGKDLAMTATIQAVAPNPTPSANTGGGVSYGGLDEMLEKPPTPEFAPKAIPLLNEQSAGVQGIKNLQLGSDGVLTSDQKSVKLDSGTQMMVQAQISGS